MDKKEKTVKDPISEKTQVVKKVKSGKKK